MTWWVLLFYEHRVTPNSLRVYAMTNTLDHLFMAWAYHKPTRHPIYRTIRGKQVLCGYRYIWDTPYISEQREPGDTLDHHWHLPDLFPGTTIWYYVFAPGGPYGLQIQGPLGYAVLPDPDVIGAIVERRVAQAFATGVSAPIQWDTVQLDTNNMVDLVADNTIITITIEGYYQITAQALWEPNAVGQRMLVVVSPAFHDLAKDLRDAPAGGIHCSIALPAIAWQNVGDTIGLHAYQNSGGNLNLSPEFLLAPYLAVIKWEL